MTLFKIGLGAERAGLRTRCNQSPAIMGAWPVARQELSDQESPGASDVLRLVVKLPSPSVNIRHRPLAFAVIVTQLSLGNGSPLRLRPPNNSRFFAVEDQNQGGAGPPMI